MALWSKVTDWIWIPFFFFFLARLACKANVSSSDTRLCVCVHAWAFQLDQLDIQTTSSEFWVDQESEKISMAVNSKNTNFLCTTQSMEACDTYNLLHS